MTASSIRRGVSTPTCQKCQLSFRNYVIIDGIARNLSSRRYCLDCSPFGCHNTRRLEGLAQAIQEKKSCVCRVWGRSVRKTVSSTRCNTCDTKVRRVRMKMLAVEYLGGRCERCGWTGSLVAFDFHHRDGDKLFAIANAAHHSWDKIRVELSKCELLCANCHRLTHYKGSRVARRGSSEFSSGKITPKVNAPVAQRIE